MRELSMMDKDMILQTYHDADNKRKAINALAKVCDVDAETIKKVLREKGALTKKAAAPIKEQIEEVKDEVIKAAEDCGLIDLDEALDEFIADQAGHDTYEPKQAKDPAKAAGPLPDYIQSVLFFKLLELEKEIEHMEKQTALARQRHEQLREFLFS